MEDKNFRKKKICYTLMKYLFLRCINILYIKYDDIQSLSCKNMNTLFIHVISAYKSQTIHISNNV